MLTTAVITALPGIQPRNSFTLEFFSDKMWKTRGVWNKLLLTDSMVDFSTEHATIK